MTKKYGPWTPVVSPGRPAHLRGDQRIEVICVGEDGEIKEGLQSRPVAVHAWIGNCTLAYRVEIMENTFTIYGRLGGTFNHNLEPQDTHRITYVIRDGEIASCKLEVL